MSRVVPPPPVDVDVMDNDGMKRLQLRLWQILLSGVTLVITAWFCSMGVIPAILTVFITKHILVAIYAVGLHPPRT